MLDCHGFIDTLTCTQTILQSALKRGRAIELASGRRCGSRNFAKLTPNNGKLQTKLTMVEINNLMDAFARSLARTHNFR